MPVEHRLWPSGADLRNSRLKCVLGRTEVHGTQSPRLRTLQPQP